MINRLTVKGVTHSLEGTGGQGAGNEDLEYQIKSLRRLVASHSNALVQRVVKNSLYNQYKYDNATDHPKLSDYKAEMHMQFVNAHAPTDSPVTYIDNEGKEQPAGGIVDSVATTSGHYGGQYYYPHSAGSGQRWQIWYRSRTDKNWDEWQCINGIDTDELDKLEMIL